MDLTASYETAVPADVLARYDFFETRNASVILEAASPVAFEQFFDMLRGFELIDADFAVPRGEASLLDARLTYALRECGWRRARTATRTTITLEVRPSTDADEGSGRVEASRLREDEYAVEHWLDRIAVELDWSARKDALHNRFATYRTLWAAGLIRGVIIVTRAVNLRDLGKQVRLGASPALVASDEGRTSATPNLRRLLRRLQKGDAGGCPILVVAISERTLQRL